VIYTELEKIKLFSKAKKTILFNFLPIKYKNKKLNKNKG